MYIHTHLSELIQQYFVDNSTHRFYNTSFLIAYSGGADSSALLHSFAAMRKLFPQLSVRSIHVHHGLNCDADKWQAHCEKVCNLLDISLTVHRTCIKSTGKGLEAAAREARYAAISRHIRQDEIVVTGQHIEDQTETVLLNLKRGAGVHGLSAMQVLSKGSHGLTLFRPLLTVTKQQIVEYLEAQQHTWVEDDSNQSEQFDRNYLRHVVVPTLTKRWPQFQQSILRSTRLLAEQASLLDELAIDDLRSIEKPTQPPFYEPSLDLSAFAQLSQSRQRNALHFWVKEKANVVLSQQQLSQFEIQFFSVREDAEPAIDLGSHQLRYFRGDLFLINSPEDVVHQLISLKLNQKFILPDQLGHVVLQDTHLGTLKIPHEKTLISVRFDSKGQKIQLKSRAHRTKLKQWFKENHVPPWQRQRIPLLFFNEDLVAVGDFLLDSRFLVDDQSENKRFASCEFVWKRHEVG